MTDARTVSELLAEATKQLADVGVDQPRLDARLLLAYAMGFSDNHVYGRENLIPDTAAATRFEVALKRRLEREPVSRILGRREFWTLDLRVTPETLDPRSDSETLVEAVLATFLDPAAELRVLDLGTGTSALLLAVLTEYRNATGVGVDQSAECIQTARHNAELCGLTKRARFTQSDWDASLNGIFDVILCNPPYIPASEIVDLDPEVQKFDPKVALIGGEDGLKYYRALGPVFMRRLSVNGRIFLEIGHSQLKSVIRLMREAGFECSAIRKDLAGHDRCLVLKVRS